MTTPKPELRMAAYYYSFEPTGVPEIDLVLSAVACAGKACHHTGTWGDETDIDYGHIGTTPVSWIVNAAAVAAAELRRARSGEEQAGRERDEARAWAAKVEAAFSDAQRELSAILAGAPDEKLDDAARRVVAERTEARRERDAIRQRVIDLFDGGFTTRRREADVASDALRELVGLPDAGPVSGMARHPEVRARERAEAERDVARAEVERLKAELHAARMAEERQSVARALAEKERDTMRAELAQKGGGRADT